MQQNSDISHLIDINDFKKCKRIGNGSFGNVYSVEKKETKELFVAKIIECGDDENEINKIINKGIESIMNINHPTIIKFRGYSKLNFGGDSDLTIIMEFPKNGSLKDVIESFLKKQEPKDYTNTTRQIIITGIARGMKLLHDDKYIHGDLKASNILLNEKYQPIITDFYATKLLNTNKLRAESRYQAPEIIKGAQFNEKIDVYAFGILMFEIINDSYAYPELEKNELSEYDFKNKVIEENYRPLFTNKINEPLKIMIEKCWSPNPDERPTFEEIFYKLSICDKKLNAYILDNVDFKVFSDYVNEITSQTDKLMAKIYFMEKENQRLKNGNAYLKEQNELHYKKIASLQNEAKSVTYGNKFLKDENDKYLLDISAHKKKIAQLQPMKEIMNQMMKNNTVSNFNSLNLKTQKYIIEKILPSSVGEMKTFFKNLNDLISFLLQFNLSDDNCININTNDNDILADLQKYNSIQLGSIGTKYLFESKTFEIKSILNLTKDFKEFIFEIEYPSGSFNYIYKEILKIRKTNNNQNKYKIALFVSHPQNSHIFENTTNIEYIKGDLTKLTFQKCSSLIHASILSPVKSIPDSIFELCTSLVKISIPSTLTTISNFAFKSCFSLKEIIIPSSVTSIGESAFSYCSSLLQVVIPSSVKSIKESAFSYCYSLKEITIPSSITLIDKGTFFECVSLAQIIIPSSVTSIGDYAFFKCKNLVQVLIPSSVTCISDSAFGQCTSLKVVSIPSSVKSIQKLAFQRCTSLEEIILPSSITSIDSLTFLECTSLKQIIIPSSVTKIGDNAFKKCSSLINVMIPLSVKSIGNGAFDNCISLRKIVLPSSVIEFDGAFSNCSLLTEIKILSSPKSIGDNTFIGCSKLLQIDIPSSVKIIGKNAFKNCKSLCQISTLFSVTLIDDYAFCLCSSLKQIAFPVATEIGNSSFKCCSSLIKIKIPSSVKRIGLYTFQFCSSLTEIIVPSKMLIQHCLLSEREISVIESSS